MQPSLSNPLLPASSRVHARWLYVCAERNHSIAVTIHRAGQSAFLTRHESALSEKDGPEITLRSTFPATPDATRAVIAILESRLARRGRYYRGRTDDFSLFTLKPKADARPLPEHNLGHVARFHAYSEPGSRTAARALVSLPGANGHNLVALRFDPRNPADAPRPTLMSGDLPLALHVSMVEHTCDAWSTEGLVPLFTGRDIHQSTGLSPAAFMTRIVAGLQGMATAGALSQDTGDDEFSRDLALYPDILSCPFVESLFATYLPSPQLRYELRQEGAGPVQAFIGRERKKYSPSVQHHWGMLESALLADRARLHGDFPEEEAQEKRLLRLLMESGIRLAHRLDDN